MSTPAGWYPQPDGQQRYWDGQQWTENFAPGSSPGVPEDVSSETVPVVARKNWFLRHKVITAVGAVLLLATFSGIAGGRGTKSVNIAPAADSVATSSAADQAAAAKAVSDQAAADQAAADQAVLDKAAADKAAADQAVLDKAAADKAAADKAAADKAAAAEAAKPKFTVSQENAIRTAQDYLDSSGFSRSGLIDQLKYEGFSAKDAQVAVGSMKVNWNVEADQSAKDYLDSSGFSRSGLIDQLLYEGFTKGQATHGANSVGL
jgi:colicin import membrane protein